MSEYDPGTLEFEAAAFVSTWELRSNTPTVDYDQIVAALSRLLRAERERHGWQNIDTVPKDGTIVDLWHVKGFRVVDEWWDAEDGWTGGWSEDQFTHWMKSPIANP